MAGNGQLPGDILKLFVTNLPEGCTPWELRKRLECFGDIAGTFVAKKRDKNGCRFGFVSVKGVRDRQEFLKSIEGIKMGDSRLKINVARFAAENAGVYVGKEAKNLNDRSHGNVFNGGASNLRDVRSYREVVGSSRAPGGQFSGQNIPVEVDARASEISIVVPDRTGAFNNLVGLAFVGRTVNLETLVDFDRLLKIAKITVANLQYLGGLYLLISFHDNESAKLFFDDKVIWGPWFSRLDHWNGQTLPLERIAWLKLCGIPLHLLDSDVLSLVGEAFGKVLHIPNLFEEDQDLSVVRVGVLVGLSKRLSAEVSLQWRNRSFRIWVEEDPVVWVPDCLARDDGSELEDFPTSEAVPLDSMEGSGIGEKETGDPAGMGGVAEESPTFNVPFSQANNVPVHEEREFGGLESCMGDGGLNREETAGSVSKMGGDLGTIFNYDSFLGKGNGVTCSDVGQKGLFVFKSGKKSKRRRKGGSGGLHIDAEPGNGGGSW
ncbi:putative RNA recognition motif domain, nucleotide-binding alpha-beta plait domain superfamily [Helianthus annuus]|nr:putative RNA recognition motif domain, nucleotide-binding alpha-beta plait domain superfamily [Helianthus annuus]KAJ0746639.1 putative RNA recognition motif domain, nucleotide-binding alpha-beta plait domain superfamily [Helianthus annuus]